MRMTKEAKKRIENTIRWNREQYAESAAALETAEALGDEKNAAHYRAVLATWDGEFAGIKYTLECLGYTVKRIGGQWCVILQATEEALIKALGGAE